MTPEALDLLDKARTDLANARTIPDAGIPTVAAREACIAAFSAAEAILFERNRDVPRTHRGVRGAFGLLVKHDPMLDRGLGRFLSESYKHKTISDHEVKSRVERSEAEVLIRGAEAFAGAIEAALAAAGDGTA